MINFHNEDPSLEEVNLRKLTKEIQTPFYIYSHKTIKETYNEISKILNCEIFYAVKANSNQSIIALLSSLGAGVDVVSIEELQRAIRAHVKPNKIIFEGAGKSEADISEAIDYNIRQINIESFDELLITNKIAKSYNKVTNIGIRVNPDIDSNTMDSISTGRKNDKFGIEINQIDKVIQKIDELKNLKLIGLSCHIGSQIFDLKIYKKLFEKMKKILEKFESNNIIIKNLDLGGGFGVDYDNSQNFDLNSLAKIMKQIFSNSKYNIAFEPGRYIVARSGFLITKILTTKKNGDINFLITDAGMQTFLRPALYGSVHRIIPFNKSNNEKEKYTIAGPICETTDILAKQVFLPAQSRNDYLIFCDVGAYGSVMASNYNSKTLPLEVMVKGNKHSIIRKKESISDIINKDYYPDWLT